MRALVVILAEVTYPADFDQGGPQLDPVRQANFLQQQLLKVAGTLPGYACDQDGFGQGA